MSLQLANILKHIRDEVAYLQRSAKGLSKADFLADETLKRAFVRSLEVIGEAVKQIPEEHSVLNTMRFPGERFQGCVTC